MWLMDVTSSDVTPSDVTPSDVISLTFHLRTVKPSGRYTFRDFTFGMFHLWQLHYWRFHLLDVTPSGCFIFGMFHLRYVSPSGCFTFGMFHLRDVSTSVNYTFGSFTFGKLHLWTFHLRTSSETVEGVILRSCNVPKVKHLKV